MHQQQPAVEVVCGACDQVTTADGDRVIAEHVNADRAPCRMSGVRVLGNALGRMAREAVERA